MTTLLQAVDTRTVKKEPKAPEREYRPEHFAGKRIEWIDVARGLGIVLVVYGHVLRALLSGGYLTEAHPLWFSDYTIYTFHMPLFFVLAGLNVMSSLKKGKGAFLLGKLWTIVYPYFLWSAVQGGIQLELMRAAPLSLNHGRSPLFLESILWRPIAQFWYLWALFVCHAVAVSIGDRKWLLALAAAASFSLSLLSFGQPTSYMLPFYVLGVFLGYDIKRWYPNLKTCLIEALMCLLFFSVAVHFGRHFSNSNPASLFSMPATLSGIALICILSQTVVRASQRLTLILTAIGVVSMTIYILHIMAYTGARLVLTRIGLHHLTGQLLFGVAAGLGIPIVAHLALDKMNLLTPLGLAPWKGKRLAFSAWNFGSGRIVGNVPQVHAKMGAGHLHNAATGFGQGHSVAAGDGQERVQR